MKRLLNYLIIFIFLIFSSSALARPGDGPIGGGDRVSGYSDSYQTPGLDDGDWHTYAHYLKFSTGEFKVWYDGDLIHNDTIGASVFDNYMHYITMGSGDASEADVFLRQFDDWEVWDGMPSSNPELNSAVISTNGTTLTLTFSAAVTQGAGYADADWDVDASVAGDNVGVTYVSGDGTDTHVYTLSSTINDGEVVNIDFNGDANSEEDGSGNDLAAIVSDSVTNNSIQDVDVDHPLLSSAILGIDGVTITLIFDELVTQGVGYADSDWDIDASLSGDDIGLTYVEGDGTKTHVYTADNKILAGETVNIDFSGGADSEEEDATGNELEAISSQSVANNSMQTGTQCGASGSGNSR